MRGFIYGCLTISALTVAACGSKEKQEGTIETSSSALVVGWDGWHDRDDLPPTLISDPLSPSGGQVQELARTASAGDYFSPWIPVEGGQTYCVSAKLKWVGGGVPFIGVQSFGADYPVWVIGSAYTDAYGPTTEVSASDVGWQTMNHAVDLPLGVTQVRLVNELYGGIARPGSPLAYFDTMEITAGACGLSIPYVETFESGAGGWVDGSGIPASVGADPDGQMGQVQVVSRNGSGGDYFSPWIGVVGGQKYCVSTKVKWVGGGTPFVGVQSYGVFGPVWVIGSAYTDAYGPTTEVDSSEAGWQTLTHTVDLPLGVTQVRLASELFGGVAKAGSPLAYFDAMGIKAGECALSIPYLETFESGAGGWADGTGAPASVAADPDGQMGQVHVVSRLGSGGDYFSPWIDVMGGHQYCVSTKVKWVGGGTPFIGVQSFGAFGPVWVIGSSYTDAYGPTTVVSETDAGWQTLNHTVDLPGDVSQIRLAGELFGGAAKAGSPLAYFDSLAITSGNCVSTGPSVPYLEMFEGGADGWADGTGTPASVTADPDGQMGQVQVVSRNGSGGDYFSPWIGITGGQQYCVSTKVKWVGGGTPFVGVQSPGAGGLVWIIGSPYTDAYGPTTEVSASESGWQTLSHAVDLPAGVTRIRLANELFGPVAKAGSPLAYFDSFAVNVGACPLPLLDAGAPDAPSDPVPLSFSQGWESGPGEWTDRSGIAPTLVTDPTSPSGPTVQMVGRAISGGDYFSPLISVVGGQTYCVSELVKWVSGGAPFLGVQRFDGAGNDLGINWLIGSQYVDVLGPVVEVSSSDVGWQRPTRIVTMPEGTSQVRLATELWDGASKGGPHLSYIDDISINSGACPSLNLDGGVDAPPPQPDGSTDGGTGIPCEGQSCPGGQICVDGFCQCSPGTELCAGQCVALLTNPDNCGACGNVCPSGQRSCSQGVCQPCGEPWPNECNNACTYLWYDSLNCGTCGHACDPGASCVRGACVAGDCSETCAPGLYAGLCCQGQGGPGCVLPFSDSQNCGACGHVCASGEACTSARCVPTSWTCGWWNYGSGDGCNCNCGVWDPDCDQPGQTLLGCTASSDTCVEPGVCSCGSLGAACGGGANCSGGNCVCPTGRSLCDGQCLDLARDSDNCGSCGNVCPSGQRLCTGGTCQPCSLGNQTECDGSCVDTTNDRDHCGACGISCGANGACVNSACIPGQCGPGTDAGTELSCGAFAICCIGGSGPECAAPASNPDHCGGCGNVCPGGQRYCADGTCEPCSQHGQVECNNACTYLWYDSLNCGTCGHACDPGASCVRGTCVAGDCSETCAPGLYAGLCCQGQGGPGCVIPFSDSQNCGACGHVCAGGEICDTGRCVPASWTCGSWTYGAGDGCNCNCGAWDPDCDQPGQPLFNCTVTADRCLSPGVCACGESGSACTGGAQCQGGSCV